MKNYEFKISYFKQIENGSVVKVNEIYMVNAHSWEEAHANLHSSLDERIAEYIVTAVSKSPIGIMIIDVEKEYCFRGKLRYVSFDEDSQREKSIIEVFVVNADSLKECLSMLDKRMEGAVVDWRISSVGEYGLVEFFDYNMQTNLLDQIDEKEEA